MNIVVMNENNIDISEQISVYHSSNMKQWDDLYLPEELFFERIYSLEQTLSEGITI